MKKPYVVGITGGIASGKSAVSSILAALGAYIIDADVVSREVVATPEIEQKLASAFPQAYKSGTLDRATLSDLVFSDPDRLLALNALVHPAIKAELNSRINKSGKSVVVLVVPLMFETGCDEMCDYIATVVADEETRIERLKNRNNNITEELARQIMRSQISENERVTRADEVIVNNESLEKLEERVKSFYQKILNREC